MELNILLGTIIYRLTLTAVEQAELLAKVQKGKASAKLIQKAHVLLASDDWVERQSEHCRHLSSLYPQCGADS